MNPDTIHAGLLAKRRYQLVGHSASDGFALSARLAGGGQSIGIAAENAVSAGRDWVLSIPAATTADLASGTYTLLLLADDGDGPQVVGSESVKLIAAAETDLRSDNKKLLDEVNALLVGKKDTSSVSYNGRSLSRYSHEELLNARDRLQSAVSTEENRAAGKGRIQPVYMRFTDA